MRSNIFNRLSFLSLFLVVVLLPLFCLPFSNVSVATSKGLLLTVGLALSIIFWAIARFIDGKIIFPKSWLLVSGFGIVLIFLLSALFSGNSKISLFGVMFDIGSFWFIFSGFILMLMSAVIFRTPKQAKIVLLGAIVSSALVIIFQSIHLFFPVITSLGILDGKTANILGSWNALGLFAGFSGLMFLLVIEFFPISKLEKILLEIFIFLSILLIAAVNFPLVWILLGISSLIIFVYKVSIASQRKEDGEGSLVQSGADVDKKHFPLISFIVVVVSLLFFMSAGFVGNIIPNNLRISNTEVSPSFSATMSVTKGVLAKQPLFGIGPNRFGEAWAMHKPVVINGSNFWNNSFDFGSGLLPTLISTTGYLGILSWLIFFILFFVIGVKSVFSSIKNGVNWEMMAFFVLSLYLFVSSFFYSTGAVIFLLSLAFTGVFIGLAASSSGEEASMSFLNDHRKSFFSILALILIVIFSVAVSFKYIERFASVPYFGKTLSASTSPVAEESINKALGLYINDLYLRTYASVHLVKFNSLAAKDAAALSDADRNLLQSSLDQAVNGAQSAAKYNPKNYINFQTLGSVYYSLASSGVKDAYSKAVEAYKIAATLNPGNPGLKLSIATASFADGKVQDAKDYGNLALSLKPDYIDALVTLSQIARSEGDNAGALAYGEKALSYAQAELSSNPQNKDLIQQNQNLIKYVASLRSEASAPASAPDSAPKNPKR